MRKPAKPAIQRWYDEPSALRAALLVLLYDTPLPPDLRPTMQAALGALGGVPKRAAADADAAV